MATNKKDEWLRLSKLYTSDEWKNNFITFSAELPRLPDLGLSDDSYQLVRISGALRFEKGNVKWVLKNELQRKSRARICEKEARDILKSFYFEGESKPQILKDYLKLTERDLYDLLNGYRYKVSDFDYNAAKFNGKQPLVRVPRATKVKVVELFDAGVALEDVAEQTKLPIRRVMKILARE